MAVHVDRVWDEWKSAIVPNDESHGSTIFEVVHLPLRVVRVGSILLLGKEQEWFVEICSVRLVVHRP